MQNSERDLYLSRIAELEDERDAYKQLADILQERLEDTESAFRVLKGQLIRKREDHLYPVSIAG